MELLDNGWAWDGAPFLPAILSNGEDEKITWRLTAHHDTWRHDPPGSDWHDSRLSSRVGSEGFALGVPAEDILAATRDAVARSTVPAGWRLGVREPV